VEELIRKSHCLLSSISKSWQYWKLAFNNVSSLLVLFLSFQLVLHTLVLSSGKFGTGIQSYFSFLRFLVLLNFLMFILMFSFVTLPAVISNYGIFNSSSTKISPNNTGKHLCVPLLFWRFLNSFSSPPRTRTEKRCGFFLFVFFKNLPYLSNLNLQFN